MATKTTTGEYSIYTLDTSLIQQIIDEKTGQLAPDPTRALAMFDTWMNSLEKQIQSATGEKGFQFNRGLRIVDPQTRIVQQQVIISNEFARIFEEQLKFFEGRTSLGDYATPFTDALKKEGAVKAEYSTSVYGRSAVNKLKQEADALGGFAEELKATKASEEKGVTRVKGTVFIPESEYLSQGTETFTQLFPETKKASNIEKRKRDIKAKKEAEEQSLAEEERKRKESDALTVQVNKMMTKAEEQEAKEIAKKEAEEEKKRKDKLNADAKEEKAREKEKLDSRKKRMAVLGVITSLVTMAVDILRRILSSVIKSSVEAKQTATEAHDLGMTYQQARRYDIFDIAKGVGKGTTTGAISDIQSMFGDVTNLNENALGVLARVMGAEVSDMVRSGMGGKEPDKLLDAIMDKYFKQFREGKNSLGQNVGQEQARRELITVLKQVSPQIAKLFSAMTEDYSSGVNKGRFMNMEEWRKTFNVNELPWGTAEAYQESGRVINEINSMIKNFKDNVMAKLTVDFMNILDKIRNTEAGMSKENVVLKREEAQQRNKEAYLKYSNVAKNQEETLKARLKEKYGTEEIPSLEDTKSYEFMYRAILSGDSETVMMLATLEQAKENAKQAYIEYQKPLTEQVDYLRLQQSSEGFNALAIQKAGTYISNTLNAVNAGKGKVLITNDDGTTSEVDLTSYQQRIQEGTRKRRFLRPDEYTSLQEKDREIYSFARRLQKNVLGSDIKSFFSVDAKTGKILAGDWGTEEGGLLDLIKKEAITKGDLKKNASWQEVLNYISEGGADPKTLLGGKHSEVVTNAFARFLATGKNLDVFTQRDLELGIKKGSLETFAQTTAVDYFPLYEAQKLKGQGYVLDLSKVQVKGSAEEQQMVFTIPVYINGKLQQDKTMTYKGMAKDIEDMETTVDLSSMLAGALE